MEPWKNRGVVLELLWGTVEPWKNRGFALELPWITVEWSLSRWVRGPVCDHDHSQRATHASTIQPKSVYSHVASCKHVRHVLYSVYPCAITVAAQRLSQYAHACVCMCTHMWPSASTTINVILVSIRICRIQHSCLHSNRRVSIRIR